ncbi:MAG TPA: GNAT family N-acetyltransferase, partial [Thermoanaerobaculia bacterium]
DDLAAIRDLLADANDTPYELARVAEEKCFEDGPSSAPRTIVEDSGARLDGLITFTAKGVRLLAVRRESRRRGLGSALLQRFDQQSGTAGRVWIYGEPGNYYLPGVPEEDRATRAFFERAGYTEDEARAVNLDVDLNRLPHPGARGTPAPHRARLADRTEILEFITSHFGELWAFESSRAFANDPPTLFIARDGGRLAGFAAHEANNRGLAFFGPMGTATAARGRGVGRALLLASLGDLRDRGFPRAVISWAANVPFYESACGARPFVRMVRFSKVVP